MRRAVGLLTLAVAAVSLACGSGGSTPGTCPLPDAGEDGDAQADSPGGDLHPEAETGEDAETPADVRDEGEKGDFGAPCLGNADCQSGFCVEGMQGLVCTRVCLEECPDGWSCRTAIVGPDLVSLCVPTGVSLCRPCAIDGQCGDGLCLGGDGAARYCGKDCSTTPCPGGYECKDVDAGERGCCFPRSSVMVVAR